MRMTFRDKSIYKHELSRDLNHSLIIFVIPIRFAEMF